RDIFQARLKMRWPTSRLKVGNFKIVKVDAMKRRRIALCIETESWRPIPCWIERQSVAFTRTKHKYRPAIAHTDGRRGGSGGR
ncbi:MAG TPA: hypothetical protein VHQ92_00690, partial [Pseudolabrys sp.]|nr:hypothetical protein [Pseudolabrys sp.]